MRATGLWIISDGKPGHENQSLGIADAMRRHFPVEVTLKRISQRSPWSWLPPSLVPSADWILDDSSATLTAPWPRLVIANGRQTVPLALMIKKEAGRHCFVTQLQNPKVNAGLFDLVVPPAHDAVTGPNILATQGAPNRVTPAILEERRLDAMHWFAPMEGKRVAVLIGGSNDRYQLGKEEAADLVDRLRRFSLEGGYGLMITTSRRTGAQVADILRQGLADCPAIFYDAATDTDGPNPYPGMLAMADGVIVTADSVSMISEACSSGKPVWIAELPGKGIAKFQKFHNDLYRMGAARRFMGRAEFWQQVVLQEADRIAAEILRRSRLFDLVPGS